MVIFQKGTYQFKTSGSLTLPNNEPRFTMQRGVISDKTDIKLPKKEVFLPPKAENKVESLIKDNGPGETYNHLTQFIQSQISAKGKLPKD